MPIPRPTWLTEALTMGPPPLSVDQAAHILDTAEALITEWLGPALDAVPDSVLTEAMNRTAQYLTDTPAGMIASTRFGDKEIQYHAPGMVSALRHSGAAALLTRWKRRRVGPV